MSLEHANDSADGSGGGEGGGAGGTGDGESLERQQEVEASRQGWVPKNRYKGPEEGWKDAATFLRQGRGYIDGLKGELADVKKQLEDFKGTAKEFAAFQQRQIEDRNQQITQLISDARREQRQAVREGDDDTADALDARLEVLREEQAAGTKSLEQLKAPKQAPASKDLVNPDGTTNDPVVTAWIADGNDWFQKNSAMRAYSFEVANELIAAGEATRGRAFLNKLRERMEDAFPRHFEREQSRGNSRGSSTETGGSRGASGGLTAADLPRADRDLMELGIAQGWTTQEKFLANYADDGPKVHRTADKKK